MKMEGEKHVSATVTMWPQYGVSSCAAAATVRWAHVWIKVSFRIIGISSWSMSEWDQMVLEVCVDCHLSGRSSSRWLAG
jgi:hypothetical protein